MQRPHLNARTSACGPPADRLSCLAWAAVQASTVASRLPTTATTATPRAEEARESAGATQRTVGAGAHAAAVTWDTARERASESDE
jgi:hypothetical protein